MDKIEELKNRSSQYMDHYIHELKDEEGTDPYSFMLESTQIDSIQVHLALGIYYYDQAYHYKFKVYELDDNNPRDIYDDSEYELDETFDSIYDAYQDYLSRINILKDNQ